MESITSIDSIWSIVCIASRLLAAVRRCAMKITYYYFYYIYSTCGIAATAIAADYNDDDNNDDAPTPYTADHTN